MVAMARRRLKRILAQDRNLTNLLPEMQGLSEGGRSIRITAERM
jgi:hypothetical protein